MKNKALRERKEGCFYCSLCGFVVPLFFILLFFGSFFLYYLNTPPPPLFFFLSLKICYVVFGGAYEAWSAREENALKWFWGLQRTQKQRELVELGIFGNEHLYHTTGQSYHYKGLNYICGIDFRAPQRQ